jgi:CRISPR-associated protein Cas8a1/Csx13
MATAERKRPAKAAKAQPRDCLTMRLFAPGMTILHRAGLGGLACTLKYIERAYAANALTDSDVPGGPWLQPNQPPWSTTDDSITLQFGEPEGARDFMQRLFAIAFQIKDGLIDLPGQYPGLPPAFAVRAELQNGVTLSFLQHGKTRDLAKTPSTVQVDPTGDGLSLVTVEYKRCGGYKHQSAWEDLVDSKGRLVEKEVPIEGPLNPGAVVRHNAFSADTKASDPPERILPLYFALVGCLAMPVNRGVGVLIIPDVENLKDFPTDRAAMTPTSARECRVAGGSDAVLQAMVRLRARGLAESTRMLSCLAVRFAPTTWSTQQKSRVNAFTADFRDAIRFAPEEPSDADLALERFEIALALLPPRVPEPKPPGSPSKVSPSKRARRSTKPKTDNRQSFWAESVVRPLVADNLAHGQRWYDDFARLASSRPPLMKGRV